MEITRLNKIFLIACLNLLLLISNVSISQNYVPFPTEDAIWNVEGENFFSNQYYRIRHGLFEDTIIEGKNYSKLYRLYDTTLIHSNSVFFAGIREENKKIYIKLNNYPEILLYDFSIESFNPIFYEYGAVCVNGQISIFPQNHYKYITSIDSVLLYNGEYRKRYRLKTNTIFDSTTWIEGIGSTQWAGLLQPLFVDIALNGDGYEFNCFKNQNSIIYLNDSGYCEKCFCGNISPVSIRENIEDNVIIFPNPVDNFLRIDSKKKIKYIEIANLLGQHLLQTQPNQKSTTINTSSLKNGIYALRILLEGGDVVVRKVIVNSE